MSRAQIVEMARRDLDYGRKGTQDQAEDIFKVPASHYFDSARFQEEKEKIFHRLPLVLAASAELPQVGDFKTIEAVGKQILITRTKQGVKAFFNMCSHRGARLVQDACGSSHRFTCPYHAWTFSPAGELVAIYSAKEFGDLNKKDYGLTELPCLERAGLVWVTLTPDSNLDISVFLSGYDSLLGEFGFDNWHHQKTQRVEGPNWKVAYDGYLDYYHLPILHRETFGTEIGNKANYYSWGPHTRMGRPDETLEEFENMADEDWPDDRILAGVWTIFPHISIASFYGGGRSVMISQLFPGETPETSHTNQIFLMQNKPETAEQTREAEAQFEFLEYVVEEEDYATGIALQKNLRLGSRDHVLFGRNERGGQYFHNWVDKILKTEDDKLNELFKTG